MMYFLEMLGYLFQALVKLYRFSTHFFGITKSEEVFIDGKADMVVLEISQQSAV